MYSYMYVTIIHIYVTWTNSISTGKPLLHWQNVNKWMHEKMSLYHLHQNIYSNFFYPKHVNISHILLICLCEWFFSKQEILKAQYSTVLWFCFAFILASIFKSWPFCCSVSYHPSSVQCSYRTSVSPICPHTNIQSLTALPVMSLAVSLMTRVQFPAAVWIFHPAITS